MGMKESIIIIKGIMLLNIFLESYIAILKQKNRF